MNCINPNSIVKSYVLGVAGQLRYFIDFIVAHNFQITRYSKTCRFQFHCFSILKDISCICLWVCKYRMQGLSLPPVLISNSSCRSLYCVLNDVDTTPRQVYPRRSSNSPSIDALHSKKTLKSIWH